MKIAQIAPLYESVPPRCEGIVSKRKESPYRSGRADCWLKVKNPNAPAVTREAEEEWN
jgi:ATP-dependent DNA ligase